MMTSAEHQIEPGLQRWKRRFLAADLEIVRVLALSARPRVLRSSAIWVSRLGNGWVYLIIIGIVVERLGRRGWPVILVAAINAALIHSIYPGIKRRIGRLRPYRTDPTLPSLLRTLDEFSFPSGHIMTLAATLVPVVVMMPGSILLGAMLMVAMSWARVATAHHYPSDVFCGAIFGLAIGSPLSLYALSVL